LRAGRRLEVTNSVNWILIIVGALAVVGEVILGAVTGFDLALIGCALAAGGAVGLLFGSPEVGLLSAGAFAFLYLAFLRRRIRSRLSGPNRATNVDAVIGRTAVVVERIAPHGAGMVRLGDELWRAALKDEGAPAIDTGATVVVDSVEGVTLKVR
jgi:membrane protein implicated in regulation of membrane protease activity